MDQAHSTTTHVKFNHETDSTQMRVITPAVRGVAVPSNRSTMRLETRSKVTPAASERSTAVGGPDEPIAVDCAT